jgi:hypothetical protein
VVVAVLRFTGRWGALGARVGAAVRGRAKAMAKARLIRGLDMDASFQADRSNRGLCQVISLVFALLNFFFEKI